MKNKVRMNVTIIDRFKIFTNQVIGFGAFGTVFLGYDHSTHKFVAVKTEKISCELNLLEIEYKILSMNKRKKAESNKTNSSHFINHETNNSSKLYLGYNLMNCYLYTADHVYRYLITDLRGSNLEILMKKSKTFTVKTVLMLAIQMIEILQYYHSLGIIHRDIKPENFLIDLNIPVRYIYLIDFGLSRKYRRPSQFLKKRIGTLRYMSPNVHERNIQGPVDDMISIGYVLVYFINGYLPWQKIKNKDKVEKFKKVYELKKEFTTKKLTDLLKCTCQFNVCTLKTTFESYFQELQDSQHLNYDKLLDLFWSCMKQHQYEYNYEWSI